MVFQRAWTETAALPSTAAPPCVLASNNNTS